LFYEAESFELYYVFVEAVLHSAFVHQESVEDPCVCEVLCGHSAGREVGGLGGLSRLGWLAGLWKEGSGKLSQWAFSILGEQGVNGLVVDAAGAS